MNVYAGLAGMYIIRDKEERELNLPAGKFEIPLVIQDKSFLEDGSLFYPASVDSDELPPDFPNPSITPGFSGDFIVVNGKVWPYLEVERRKYRFRILNASNERFYRIRLSSGQPFIQIGSDGGLLHRPVCTDEITIAPAERVDVIIDFSKYKAGAQIEMTNDAPTPFDFGEPPDPNTTGRIMQFRVIESESPDTSVIPSFLSKINKLRQCEATRIRDIILDVTNDRFGRLKFMLSNHEYIDRITERPVLGDVEIWRLINPSLGAHPIHLHLVQFQVIDRIPLDVDAYNLTGQIRYAGKPELPALNERGWKDTVIAPSGYVTRIIMRFGPYTGRYMYHCHILEHEDYDMMRPFEVVSPKCARC